jgi:mycothione reductase
MRLTALPRRLVVLGGGFIAAELGHVFGALGSEVTIVNRSERLLMHSDEDISIGYTEAVRDRYDLHLGAHIECVEPAAGGVVVHLTGPGGAQQVEGDVLLLAFGRIPNGDQLDAERGGVRIGSDGEVVVDDYGRTTAPGVWALGDVNGRYQLKHMANGEAKVIAHNLVHPDDLQPLDPRPAPHAVFGHPQIGSIGLTESEALDRPGPVAVVRQPYGAAAYGWAMEDTEGFVKLIGDPRTRKLRGAHVLGHEASVLVQLLVQGMHLGNTVDEMANQIWIHPALSEVVEQALLALIDDFDELT